MVVIAVQPGRQQVMALLVGGERLAVGPVLEQGAGEALHLAVALRALVRGEDTPRPAPGRRPRSRPGDPRRPCTTGPPPPGMRASFLTSMCPSSPGCLIS